MAGILEAVLVAIALTLLNVPGAIVWATLAFFSELIPKAGAYIMALPPLLVALSESPMTALWVALFYIAMNELVGDFVVPRIRAVTMNLHPASILFVMLCMAAAFGLAGALIATPVTAFIKAYFEEFYLSRRESLEGRADQIERILMRNELE